MLARENSEFYEPNFWMRLLRKRGLTILNIAPLMLLIFLMVFLAKYINGPFLFVILLIIYISPLILFPLLEKYNPFLYLRIKGKNCHIT
jgi:hypothetical protein